MKHYNIYNKTYPKAKPNFKHSNHDTLQTQKQYKK